MGPDRENRHEITELLNQAENTGEAAVAERLWSVVYGELRKLAEGQLRRERVGHTLQPTALVNEAFVRLVDAPGVGWKSRNHFFGVAARVMRQVLVDYSRRRAAAKRGGEVRRVTMDSGIVGERDGVIDFLDLHEALQRLTELDERTGRIVELRFFAGMTVDEAAEAVGVSPRKAAKDWSAARLWLSRELQGG